MSTSHSKRTLTLLRTATALVVLFGLGMTVWLIDKAVLNPDVKTKRPSWFAGGAFDVPYWAPLILTIVVGAACVVFVYARAAHRLKSGEDLYANSYRDRVRQGEANEQR